MGIEKILVVDDDPLSRDFLAEALRTLRYEPIAAACAVEGLALFHKEAPDLVLSDLKMPGTDGIQFLQQIKKASPETPFVLLTAHGTVEAAVSAMKLGAADFLLKPIAPEALEVVLSRADRDGRLRKENEYLRGEIHGDGDFVGQSPAFESLAAEIQKVARTKATVLITGESGTGKERVAHKIHYSSPRSKGPFVRVNCAALSSTLLESELFGHEKGAFTGAVQKREGRFELADGGTLLLDEISEIPMSLQAKLLRVLEEEEFERVGGTKTMKVDVRVIATTNRNLHSEVRRGKFREDLFYRLNVLPIQVPPLRDRREDIPALAEHFLRRFAAQQGSRVASFSAEALEELRRYAWPGNVRELENVVQRLVVRDPGPAVRPSDLAGHLQAAGCIAAEGSEDAAGLVQSLVGRSLADIERDVILNTLAATGGNKSEAARILGVTARTLSNKMKLYRELGVVTEARNE